MNLFRRKPDSPLVTPAGFRELYERNRLPVFRYIYGLIGGPQDDVEDLTAETFLRAWKARYRFAGEADAAAGWLIQIAKRLVIDNYRRSVHAERTLLPPMQAESTPEEDALAGEQKRFLMTLLRELSDEPREILTLRYMLGWQVNQIARHLGKSENSVSVTIHRTLTRLKERWLAADAERLPMAITHKEETA